MKLAYVGDGPRDEQMVPALVTQWIGPHERTFEAWHDIRLHTGWARKLKYAAIRAARDGVDGLVATLDRDAAAPRLPDLVAVRDELRGRGETLPMALGEAVPHGEAWLVDDLVPLRTVLGHPPNEKAPARRHPKNELNALIRASGRTERAVEIMGLLAAEVDIDRCRHARETGLRAFHEDVKRELG